MYESLCREQACTISVPSDHFCCSHAHKHTQARTNKYTHVDIRTHVRTCTHTRTHTTWPPSFGQQMWQCRCCAKQPGPDVWPGLSSSNSFPLPSFLVLHSCLHLLLPVCSTLMILLSSLMLPSSPPSTKASLSNSSTALHSNHPSIFHLFLLSPPHVSNFPFLCPLLSTHIAQLIHHTCPLFWAPVFHSPPPSFNVPFFIIFSACILRFIIFSVLAIQLYSPCTPILPPILTV